MDKTVNIELKVKFHDDLMSLSEDEREEICDALFDEFSDELVKTGDCLSRPIVCGDKEYYIGFLENSFYVMKNNENASSFTYWKLEKLGVLKVIRL